MRGVPLLRRLLEEQTLDLRELDLAGFRDWLARHLDRWQNDPVFSQRTRIRELRRAFPKLRTLEHQHRRQADADARSTDFPRLRELTRELSNTGKAVAGLTHALRHPEPTRAARLRSKLDAFLVKQQGLRRELAEAIRSSPERRTLLRLRRELRQLRSSTGLDQEEARLASMLKKRGQRSGGFGKSFEQTAVTLSTRYVIPEIASETAGDREAGRAVQVLQGVTLSAARIELDQVIVSSPRENSGPVDVLAVVEVKRNINDLASGFQRRQENLAWLCGETGDYEPDMYRTRQFRSGHFDREAVHEQYGERFVFTRDSFRHFRREPGDTLFWDRLYFITREGPIWGVSTAALARISHRVASDLHWDPDSDVYLHRLLGWCQSIAQSFETPDVLRGYASTPTRAKHLLVVGPQETGG